jgi:methionyl-tRNA formyltransferase
MRDPVEIEAFAALNLDAGVVVAFGQILPAAVLEAPRLGCFNLHASLLPRWRGAAPIQRAIMAGDKVTGVEVMQMTEGLDEGPVLSSETVRIDALETAGTLHDRLAEVGAGLLARTMAAVERGEMAATPQPDEGDDLRQEDPRQGGPYPLEQAGGRGRSQDPRALAVPRRLVRAAH